MFASFLARWPFLAAVALVSAAVSDVVVETVSNTGIFGSSYYDSDDSSIAPSLFAAMLLAIYVIGLHVLALCRQSRGKNREWLTHAAREVATHMSLRDFPAIAGMQFAALFGMESVEQFAAAGHLAGGAIWLGGPLLASIAAHVIIGAACTFIAGRLMRMSLAGFASLMCIALEFVLCALDARAAGAFVARRDASSCSHAQAARVRHISGRAPPFSPLPA